ncbi:ATP-binding protein [Streptomyces sp. Li-HN-5-11]|uniref:ATP-binding protein n=1 Tax=Streptomyces sp. Li-HN-5-11 TaxID=3075432 RepID=UPI0028A5F250|nr:ATP-binding protein [Streptomyces sp. Li-HN-5-11]WNM31626.1 ATP-binding protein [Streptomyces sp. Li-HN-5-11]
MSHLRAPAARTDRREGGRHGRPVARTVPSLPETHIRPQLLRLAVLPPTAVALGAGAAVLFTVRSTGARPGPILWAVLAGAFSVTLAGIATAAVAAGRAARSVHDRITALRRSTARREADLRALVDALRHGEAPPQRLPRGGPPDDADEFELLASDLARAHDQAVTAVVQATQLSSQAGSEQKLEVFVNLARRLQSLVHREISILDELENEIEDPDLLKGLFHVDHLATRIRRHAENLAVLGGAVSRRQWSHPVSMTEVLRSAIAEVEQYSRVKLVPPIDGRLRGHAVADVIHLLAELVENATLFSAPQTQVLLRANLVTSGLAVEVEDRGLGMPVGEQVRMNALLADPDQVNVASLLADGRIGLFVVSQLAKRHGITVRLQTNIYGGVQAVLVVPQALLGTMPGAPGEGPRTEPVPAAGTGRPPAAPPYAPGPPGGPGAPHQVTPHRSPTGSPAAPARGGRHASPATGVPAGGPLGAAAGTVNAGSDADLYPPSSSAPGGPAGNGRSPSDASGTDGRPPAGVHGGDPGSASGAWRTDSTSPAGLSDIHGRSATGGSGDGVRPRSGADGEEPVPVPPESGGGPAPLPRRAAREGRPNPAEAVPGIRPEDRAAVAADAGMPPAPRAGAVRGTMGKPQLPRRRAQQHIVPQLRGGPAPRPDTEYVAGHDPGLMAAFQRGIGLAETRQHRDAAPPAPARPDEPAARADASALDAPLPEGPPPTAAQPVHASLPTRDLGAHTDVPVPGHDLSTRHDGSAPAG